MMRKNKPLPPYGQQFIPVPESGVRVAVGRNAWSFAQQATHPIMVLPVGSNPACYRWPSDGNPALIHERGEMNDRLLEAVASELLKAGASSIVVLREALIDSHDCRVFYDAEVLYAVA